MERGTSPNTKALPVRERFNTKSKQSKEISSISEAASSSTSGGAKSSTPEDAPLSESIATADTGSILISSEPSMSSMSLLTSEFANPDTPDEQPTNAPNDDTDEDTDDDTAPATSEPVYVLPGIAISTLLRPPNPKEKKPKRKKYIGSPLSKVLSSDDVGGKVEGTAGTNKRSFSPDLNDEPAPKKRKIVVISNGRKFKS